MNAKTQELQTTVSSISAFQLQPGQFLFKFCIFLCLPYTATFTFHVYIMRMSPPNKLVKKIILFDFCNLEIVFFSVFLNCLHI